jgi:hypothetical protein
MCQRANFQVICVDLKLFGTTSGIIKTSANLLLLHGYGRILCMHHGHIMAWHKHSDICYVWLCECVIYHTCGGISSLNNNKFIYFNCSFLKLDNIKPDTTEP